MFLRFVFRVSQKFFIFFDVIFDLSDFKFCCFS